MTVCFVVSGSKCTCVYILSECVCYCNCAGCIFVNVSGFSLVLVRSASLFSSVEDEYKQLPDGGASLKFAKPCCSYTTRTFLLKAGRTIRLTTDLHIVSFLGFTCCAQWKSCIPGSS